MHAYTFVHPGPFTYLHIANANHQTIQHICGLVSDNLLCYLLRSGLSRHPASLLVLRETSFQLTVPAAGLLQPWLCPAGLFSVHRANSSRAPLQRQGRLHNEGVGAIKAKLWLDHDKGPKMPTFQIHIYPATSVTSPNTSPCCCYVPSVVPPAGAPAACALFTLLSLLSFFTGEYPTSELAFDRACMMWEEGVARRVGSHLFPREAGPFGPPVHTVSGPSTQPPAPSSVSASLCFPTAPARLHAWQTDRCYLPCISSSGPLSLSTNSPLLAHRLQILSASLPLDKGQYQWQNIFYVWNVAHNKQSSIRFV